MTVVQFTHDLRGSGVIDGVRDQDRSVPGRPTVRHRIGVELRDVRTAGQVADGSRVVTDVGGDRAPGRRGCGVDDRGHRNQTGLATGGPCPRPCCGRLRPRSGGRCPTLLLQRRRAPVSRRCFAAGVHRTGTGDRLDVGNHRPTAPRCDAGRGGLGRGGRHAGPRRLQRSADRRRRRRLGVGGGGLRRVLLHDVRQGQHRRIGPERHHAGRRQFGGRDRRGRRTGRRRADATSVHRQRCRDRRRHGVVAVAGGGARRGRHRRRLRARDQRSGTAAAGFRLADGPGRSTVRRADCLACARRANDGATGHRWDRGIARSRTGPPR